MAKLREIVVDNFAGGGGASTGIEIAMGRSVDVAINHDPAAIAMHRANHPTTKHYRTGLFVCQICERCKWCTMHKSIEKAGTQALGTGSHDGRSHVCLGDGL